MQGNARVTRRPTHRLAAVLLLLLASDGALASILSEYVAQPDSAYRYTPLGVVPGNGYEVHQLHMTSQAWRARNAAGSSVWEHAVVVVKPTSILSSKSLLLVGGGRNTSVPSVSQSELSLAVQIALASGTLVSVVSHVPNQPLSIDAEPNAPAYEEDRLVAASFDRAMDSGDYASVVYLPMTKSVVRAMDTVSSYLSSIGAPTISGFIVMGFSKRGAATWLASAVDHRVIALVPGVFDVLRMAPQFERHYRAYGFYAPAVQDYVDFDILRRVRTPEGQQLLRVVDPYSYRAAVKQPKFLINSPGDQFFLPDSAELYLHGLEGETRLRYVPNTDHSLSTVAAGPRDALVGFLGWYQAILRDLPRPALQWRERHDSVHILADHSIASATLWRADNPIARDFRRESIGPVWVAKPAALATDRSLFVELGRPDSGYRASFVEVVFAGPNGLNQIYSTPVFVQPRTLPFELIDNVGTPHSVEYWRARVETAARLPALSDSLSSYFPFPVLNQYIYSVAEAAALFGSHDPSDNAKKACLATRLNIASGELGWYSQVPWGWSSSPLWQPWRAAYEFSRLGLPHQAKRICVELNRL